MNYRTAWLMHNKIIQVISQQEEARVLRGKVQIDAAYFGGELSSGKAGRGSENKVPIVAAISLDEEGHPIHVKVSKVKAFSFPAVVNWAQSALARGSEVISNGLACFRAVTEVGCIHYATVLKGRHPKDLPDFRWINTVISNLKTSFSGTFHALHFDKNADHYLGAFSLRELPEQFSFESILGLRHT